MKIFPTVLLIFAVISAVIFFNNRNSHVTLRGNVTKTPEGYIVFNKNIVTNTVGTSDMWVYEGTNGIWGFIFPKNFDIVTSLKGKYPHLVRYDDYTRLGTYVTEVPFYIPGSRFLWDPVKKATVSVNDRVHQCILVVDLSQDPDFR